MVLSTILMVYFVAVVVMWICLSVIYRVECDRYEKRFVHSAIAIMSILWPMTLAFIICFLFQEKEK